MKASANARTISVRARNIEFAAKASITAVGLAS
jgi:hypothetical protein